MTDEQLALQILRKLIADDWTYLAVEDYPAREMGSVGSALIASSWVEMDADEMRLLRTLKLHKQEEL